MRWSIFALAPAGLCAPGAALAQSSATGPMTTTPGVTCSGSGATGDCEVNQLNDSTDPLGTGGTTGSGTLGNTMPGTSGGGSLDSGSGTVGGSAGTLNDTIPGASGGGGLGTGTTGTTGGSSGTLVPTTPDSSLGSGGSLGGSSGGGGG